MEADARHRSKKAHRHLMGPVNPLCAQIEERSAMPGRILNMSPKGIFIVQDGRVKECDHFLAAQAGYAMDEIAGTCFASFFDRESIPAVEAFCGQISSGRAMISLPQAVLVCKDGKSLEVRLNACACRFGGKPAVRVTFSALGQQAADDSWEADLDCFFVSEEKGINYRMHPANLPCLTAADIDVCILANNHVLDWGYEGLAETTQLLNGAGIATAGVGGTIVEAERPVTIEFTAGNRLLIFAFGLPSSGVDAEWAATTARPGVAFLPDLSDSSLRHITDLCHKTRQPGDIVLVSLHWGGNWGYQIPAEQRVFAHRLIDAGVDQVHRTIDIGLYALKRIVLRCRYNLRCGSVDYVLYTVKGTSKAVLVTDVADYKTYLRPPGNALVSL